MECFEINSQKKLPVNAILVTMDVSSLYTNIDHLDATSTTRKVLNRSNKKEIPTEFLIRLLELVLKHNLFEFNGETYKQIIGFAMGSRPAPPVANIFMTEVIDKAIFKIAHKYGDNALRR